MKIKQQKQIKAFLIEEFGNKKGCAVSDRQEFRRVLFRSYLTGRKKCWIH